MDVSHDYTFDDVRERLPAWLGRERALAVARAEADAALDRCARRIVDLLVAHGAYRPAAADDDRPADAAGWLAREIFRAGERHGRRLAELEAGDVRRDPGIPRG